ncbi:hypothetical protein [Actinomadura coerulea]
MHTTTGTGVDDRVRAVVLATRAVKGPVRRCAPLVGTSDAPTA